MSSESITVLVICVCIPECCMSLRKPKWCFSLFAAHQLMIAARWHFFSCCFICFHVLDNYEYSTAYATLHTGAPLELIAYCVFQQFFFSAMQKLCWSAEYLKRREKKILWYVTDLSYWQPATTDHRNEEEDKKKRNRLEKTNKLDAVENKC